MAPHPTAGLRRDLSPAELAAYWRDGVVIVRGILPTAWIEAMRGATEDLMADPAIPAVDYADDGGPRFFSLTYAWKYHPLFEAWALHGPLLDLSRQVLPEATALNLVLDQVFAREAGAAKTTPFHQDHPYSPTTEPDHSFRHWVPLDVVTPQSGAVHFLRGSHRGPIYQAFSFDRSNPVANLYSEADYFSPLPDFEATYDEHDWVVGAVEPGDVILFHPLMVHGTRPATEAVPRRAITNVYADEHVRWNPHPANAYNNRTLMGHQGMPDLAPGDRLDCEHFPRVWTAPAA